MKSSSGRQFKIYLQSYTVSSKKQKRNPIENKLSTGCESAGIKML